MLIWAVSSCSNEGYAMIVLMNIRRKKIGGVIKSSCCRLWLGLGDVPMSLILTVLTNFLLLFRGTRKNPVHSLSEIHVFFYALLV